MRLRAIANDDRAWTDLHGKLVVFTKKRLRSTRWRDAPYGKGLGISDFVHEAFVKALDGRRECNNDIDLYAFLAGIIKSDISNLATSKEIRTTQPLDSDAMREYETRVVGMNAFTANPEEFLYKKEEAQLAKDLFSDDPVAQSIIHLIMDRGISSSSMLDAELGIGLRAVCAARRRIVRRLKQRNVRHDALTPSEGN